MNAISPPRPGWVDQPPLPRLPDLRPEITPYPFQDFTLRKAALQPVFAIGAATGLGKTFMAWDRCKRIRYEQPNTRFLILTNKSATLQFAGEYQKFYSDPLNVTAVHDKMDRLGQKVYRDTREEAYRRFSATNGDPHLDALVMNYHLFRGDCERDGKLGPLLQAVQRLIDAGFHLVLIADEATAFKNRATVTHRAVHTLVSMIKPRLGGSRVVLLTATLTKGKLEEVFGIFDAVGLSHVIAPSWEAFLEEFCVTSASRKAMVAKAKLDQIYAWMVQLNLDGNVILGRKAFYRTFNIRFSKGWGKLSKHDLDQIRQLCCRSPVFVTQVPTLAAFYQRLGVQFEEREVAAEPVITAYANTDRFIARTQPYMVALRKVDVGEFLPPFVTKRVMLEHTPEQRQLIRQIYLTEVTLGSYAEVGGDLTGDADGYAEVQGGILPVERLTEQGYIRRALLDPRLVHKHRLDDLSSKSYAPKTEELLRFLRDEATGERVIVYTPSKVHLQLLAATIRAADGLDDWYTDPLEIHGDVKTLDREHNRQLFQTSDTHRLILLNDAGLESLNLQSASILIVLGLPRSGGDMIQLAGRLSRLGSQHQSLLLLYYLIQGSQDEDDYMVTQRSMQIVSLIMGEAERGLIDHKALREFDGVDEGVSQEDYRRASQARLVLARRSRRMRSYGVSLPR